MSPCPRSLRRAWTDGDDLEARTDLSITSLMGGLALANAKLGAVHGFAGPLGGKYPAPHGAVCARLLPGVMEANAAFARQQAGSDPWAAEVLARYDEVARLLTGRAEASIEDGCAWVRTLVDELGIRPLSAFGLRREALPTVVDESMRSSSMKGNPFVLPAEILSALPSDHHAAFLAEYAQALETARRPEHYRELTALLRLWRRGWFYRRSSSGYRTAIAIHIGLRYAPSRRAILILCAAC